eukprot:322119-Hanusia_phi.AAC.2
MLPQHASVRDGGTGVDGISRAGLNKIVGNTFNEGMRKPSRNGNPGELGSVAAHKLARHFLRARWRNPDDSQDLVVLQQMFCMMQPHQVANCVLVLREFSKWRPGPAGRGGDRASGKLGEFRKLKQEEESRCVKQKIEDTREKDVCEDDDDDNSDAFSMRSTVVNVRRVQESDEISIKKASPEMASDTHSFKGLLTPATTVQEILNQSSVNTTVHNLSDHKLSSADILNTLFLQVAASRVSQANAPSGISKPFNALFPAPMSIKNSFANDSMSLSNTGLSISPPTGLSQFWNHQIESSKSTLSQSGNDGIVQSFSDSRRSQGPILPPLKQVLLESAIRST